MDTKEISICGGQNMSAEALKALFADCPVECKKRGEMLFRPGEQLKTLWTLTKGTLKVYRLMPNGTQRTMGYITKGTIIGTLSALSKEPSEAYCEVLSDAVLKICPRDLFIARLIEHDLVEEYLYNNAKKEMRSLSMSAALSCPQEVVETFMKEGLTQQEIADILGYSRVQVSRICSKISSQTEGGKTDTARNRRKNRNGLQKVTV